MKDKMKQVTLAGARVSAGMTQQELADQMGVSKQTVLDWELGRREMKTAYFYMFCGLTGFSKDQIFLPFKSTESKQVEVK